MSHMIGDGVAHSHLGQDSRQQQKQWRAPTALKVYSAHMANRHENSGSGSSGFNYFGNASDQLPSHACPMPAVHVSESLSKRLRERTLEAGQPQLRWIPLHASAAAAAAAACSEVRPTQAVMATNFAHRQQQQQQQQEQFAEVLPSRLQKNVESDNKLLETSLAALQLYSRHCEEMESRGKDVAQAGIQGNGTTNTVRAGPDPCIVGNRIHEVQARAERSIMEKVWIGPYTMPTADTQADPAASKTKALAAATLRAKKAKRIFDTKRVRIEKGINKEQITEVGKQQFPAKQPSPNRIISWSAPGSTPVQKTHWTTRLTELRACVGGKDGAPQPRVRVGHLSANNVKQARNPAQSHLLPSRLEELRQHAKKHSTSNHRMAARLLPLQQINIAKSPMTCWTGAVQVATAPAAPSAAKMQERGVFNGMFSEGASCNVSQYAFNAGSGGKALVQPVFLDSKRQAIHAVFDTCSLLKANEFNLDWAMQHCVVCIPFDVIAELDGINRSKGCHHRGKTESSQLRFSARQVRNWISGAIEKGGNVRVQRRCEVEAVYDRKVATKDDSILGFAVFLEQQHLAVEFITNDKFLRVKAISELKGGVYNLSEFLQRHRR
ncbi:hypothetical protein TraAM80_04032 [Trypanosoma rangeli]|uniref:PIN domain-containing protein n=1 Tax=Trypanosoma rangeli TaxID=5698 RepID=A0A422NLJ1_TRYRA|nr:uncharacterized protein TraAM80_04032 [Trypanosoma rangeli]RNF06335.1 hypothetical protein TraAM80_04032 [Trypanosoma rangeli]|eukprot:RNF06335.1 hypothetical protein TraAM80_04032 [Trypanosoma rangeli]